jgi:hypothetical protein
VGFVWIPSAEHHPRFWAVPARNQCWKTIIDYSFYDPLYSNFLLSLLSANACQDNQGHTDLKRRIIRILAQTNLTILGLSSERNGRPRGTVIAHRPTASTLSSRKLYAAELKFAGWSFSVSQPSSRLLVHCIGLMKIL